MQPIYLVIKLSKKIYIFYKHGKKSLHKSVIYVYRAKIISTTVYCYPCSLLLTLFSSPSVMIMTSNKRIENQVSIAHTQQICKISQPLTKWCPLANLKYQVILADMLMGFQLPTFYFLLPTYNRLGGRVFQRFWSKILTQWI